MLVGLVIKRGNYIIFFFRRNIVSMNIDTATVINDQSMIIILNCHPGIFIPNIPVRRVSGNMNAENIVR